MNHQVIDIVYGLVLGDGSLRSPTRNGTLSSLRLKYDDKFFPYLEWLHKKLSPIGVSPIRKQKVSTNIVLKLVGA